MEDDEDEEYDEEGGDEDEEVDYGDYDEEEVDDDEWPPKDVISSGKQEDRFFRAGDSLRGKYSEVEIGGFMKLLGVKPRTQWEDTSVYHGRMGVHTYEDEAQENDLDWHLLGEAEREAADRQQTENWRKGSEVKMVVDGREPLRPVYRF